MLFTVIPPECTKSVELFEDPDLGVCMIIFPTYPRKPLDLNWSICRWN